MKSIGLALLFASSAIGCAAPALDGDDDSMMADDETGETSQALTAPGVLASVNTCDGIGPKLVASSTGKLVLDPGDGSQRFRANNLISKVECIVAAQFNVPTGYRARLGIAVGAGKATIGPNQTISFAVRAGFTSRRPLTTDYLLGGPTVADVFGNGFTRVSGPIDVQVDHRDSGHADVVTSCGQRNVWFYVLPTTSTTSIQKTDIDLNTVLGSMKLERCN